MKTSVILRQAAAWLALAGPLSAGAQLQPQVQQQPQAQRQAQPATTRPADAAAVRASRSQPAGGLARAGAPAPASRAPAVSVPAAAPPAGPHAAGVAEYERQLSAIRKALLHTTLEQSPTRVVSSAWIDRDGRLHENAQFSSDATVRGVRVLSYLQDENENEDEAAEAEARVVVDMLPAGLVQRQATKSDACADTRGRWRNLLQFQVQAPTVLQGEQGHVAQWILHQARLAWLPHAERSRRWQVQAQPASASGAYERALYGPPPTESWRAVLRIAPASPPPRGLLAWLGWPEERGLHFELSLTVAESAARTPFWHSSGRVHIPLAWLAEGPAFWRARLGEALHARMAEWMQSLDAQGACLPVHFDVAPADTAWTLQAGAANGLRTGDRLLILDRSQLPERVLHQGAVNSLGLVEVQHVDAHRARLRQLAGPPLTARSDLVAFPF